MAKDRGIGAEAGVAQSPGGRGWPLGFRRLITYVTLGLLAGQSFSGFLTPYLRERGIPVEVIGLYYGIVGGIGVLTATLGGWIADTRGRRLALLVGDACRFAGWGLLLLFPGRLTLFAVTALAGMGWAAGSAFQALIAELAPPGRRAFAFAASTAVESAVGMIVPVLIGFAADWIGLRPALALALVPGLLSLYWIRLIPETLGSPAAAPGLAGEQPARLARPSPGDGLRFTLSRDGRGALVMGAIWWVTVFQFYVVSPARPLYVLDRFGLSYSELGLVSTVAAFGSVVGPVIGGRIADRVGYARLMTITLVAAGIVGLTVPLAGTPMLYAVLLLLTNLIGWIPAPCWGAVSAASAPRELRGSVGGLFGALRAFGGAAGGAAAGLIYSRWIAGPQYVFAIADIAMGILAYVAWRKGWAGFGSRGWE